MKTSATAAITRSLAIGIAFFLVAELFVVAFRTTSMHLMQLHFNPYALITVVALVVNLGLLVYLGIKGTFTAERVWLSVFLVAAIIFAVSELMQRLSIDPGAVLFWANLGTIALISGPAMYLFALAYTQTSERRYPYVVAILIITTLIFVFFENFTNLLFINDTKYAVLLPWGYDYRTSIAPNFWVTGVWFDGMICLAIARLLSFRRHTLNPILRRQSLFYAVAFSIPFIGGSFTDIILPLFGVTNVLSFTLLLTTVTALLLIYGSTRYQLLTVNPSLFSNTILSIMQEAVVVTDPEFHIQFMNPKAEELLGSHVSHAIHEALLTDRLAHTSLAPFRSAFQAAPKPTDMVQLPQVMVVGHDAKEIPVRVTASHLELAGIAAWVIVLSDISAELHSRSIIEHEVDVRTTELHQARAYLLSSINSLGQGFVLINAEAKVEVINGAAAKLFNVDAEVAADKPLSTIVEQVGWHAQLVASVAKVLATGEPGRLDVSASNGAFYQVFITAAVSDSTILGAAIVIEDITEEKLLNRSKDEFISIASHELRTPLTAIRGNMSIIQQTFKDAMKDTALAGMINDTKDASIRLIDMVNDFLDSSKLEQGKMEFRLQPVDVLPVASKTIAEIHPLLAKRHNTVTIDKLESLPAVQADQERLQQILSNLLSNANKYTEDGNITISGEVSGDTVKIRVSDTGRGISTENQKLLFHKFQQAGNSLLVRDTSKGTGLGLYISRLLAEHMHGSLELEQSAVGKGSTFVLTLPRKYKKA